MKSIIKTNSITKTNLAVTLLAIFAGLSSLTITNMNAQTQPQKSGYVDVNGLHMYYEIHGAGKPLVLLHGGLFSSSMFGPTIPALAAGRKVIAVDLQGHGHTADIDRPLSIQFMADDIAGLLKQLGIASADIMGYSLGGGVALQMAVRHPEMVRKLVLVSTPMRRNAFYPDLLAQQAYVNAAMAEQMKQTPMYQTYAKENPRPEDWSRLLDKLGEYMKKDFDYSYEIKGIKIPTLIVAGDADIFPPAHAVEMFNLLGGGLKDGAWDGSGKVASQLAILPSQTHYTMGVSPKLTETVIPFLDNK